MGLLDHRHALITGGGTGIGASIARVLAGLGASVSIAGRRRLSRSTARLLRSQEARHDHSG